MVATPPRIVASETVLGDYCVFDGGQWLPKGHDDPRYEVPETIVIWGYNIPASCPDNIFGHWVTDLMKKGAKVITIDPRLSLVCVPLRQMAAAAAGNGRRACHGVSQHRYSGKALRQGNLWRNGPMRPHLIRKDTGKLLRESDLISGGSPENFVVWDISKESPIVWNSGHAEYGEQVSAPAMEGEYRVTLKDGTAVAVTTVWGEFCAEAAKYPVDKVAEITMLKEQDIIEAARMYARSKPATIQWGLAIDSTPGMTPTGHCYCNPVVHHRKPGCAGWKRHRQICP